MDVGLYIIPNITKIIAMNIYVYIMLWIYILLHIKWVCLRQWFSNILVSGSFYNFKIIEDSEDFLFI